jgi:hypothetical protein
LICLSLYGIVSPVAYATRRLCMHPAGYFYYKARSAPLGPAVKPRRTVPTIDMT